VPVSSLTTRASVAEQEEASIGSTSARSNRLCAEGLKEGIGFVPIEEEEKDEERVDRIDTENRRTEEQERRLDRRGCRWDDTERVNERSKQACRWADRSRDTKCRLDRYQRRRTSIGSTRRVKEECRSDRYERTRRLDRRVKQEELSQGRQVKLIKKIVDWIDEPVEAWSSRSNKN